MTVEAVQYHTVNTLRTKDITVRTKNKCWQSDCWQRNCEGTAVKTDKNPHQAGGMTRVTASI